MFLRSLVSDTEQRLAAFDAAHARSLPSSLTSARGASRSSPSSIGLSHLLEPRSLGSSPTWTRPSTRSWQPASLALDRRLRRATNVAIATPGAGPRRRAVIRPAASRRTM